MAEQTPRPPPIPLPQPPGDFALATQPAVGTLQPDAQDNRAPEAADRLVSAAEQLQRVVDEFGRHVDRLIGQQQAGGPSGLPDLPPPDRERAGDAPAPALPAGESASDRKMGEIKDVLVAILNELK